MGVWKEERNRIHHELSECDKHCESAQSGGLAMGFRMRVGWQTLGGLYFD
jgi:hypothetical protein